MARLFSNPSGEDPNKSIKPEYDFTYFHNVRVTPREYKALCE